MLPYSSNIEYLRDELRRLDWLLKIAIQQFRSHRNQNIPPEFQGLHISDQEIDGLVSEENESWNQTWAETQTKVMAMREEIDRRIIETQINGIILRLPYLQTVFNLTPFETDLLLLTLAPELDLRYQKIYAYLQDDVTRKRPSIDLALQLFCCTLEERVKAREPFIKDSPLLNYNLLLLHEDSIDRPSPLLSRSLKLDDRIAEFLLGSDRLDTRLLKPISLVQWLRPQKSLKDLVLPTEIKQTLQQLISLEIDNTPWLCLLQGVEGTGKRTTASAVANARKRSLLAIDLPAMIQAELPFHALLELAFREARLYNSLVYLDGWHQLLADTTKHHLAIAFVEQIIAQFPGIVFIASQTPWQPNNSDRHSFIRIEFSLPDLRSRYALWQTALSQAQGISPQVNIKDLANSFRLSGGQIQRSIALATSQAKLNQGKNYTITTDDILLGCQLESSRTLISFARKITPKRVWEDLVLPKDTMAQLRELCQQVRYRSQVYSDWGFEQRLSLGKGTIALFTGDSGTGKTLSVEILAKELGLDLYQVDLSQIVSKYIGETEKNLSRVFEDAQASNAILFFDEADALFGKRSDIKDAHDRYANIEVNYLLQRVETYEGVIILTSNLSKNIDTAFLRRLHFSIEFPFPDEYHRFQIWRRMFPPQAPLSTDVDFEFLARKFKIAGGNIKNVAIAAAFRAAEDGGEIHMEHLILSLKREYRKLGKVCERTEFESYYDLVR
ncbi:AAA family ATPase [Floridanema aerugineum]|uniref:AAA family ATPase n=1 Tax=Floridaenema aerugineum BLCC-F46 TaxID=3153654 RepID=A0ABV4XFK2_9CYAN